MRVAGFALFGILIGAVAGLVAALLGLALWYDVLGFSDSGGDGMSGLAAALALSPVLSLVGAVAGGIWFGRRASAGPVGTGHVVVGLILTIVGLVAVSGMVI